MATIPDFADISDICQRSVRDSPDYLGVGNERNSLPTDADFLDGTNLSFHLSGMIADHPPPGGGTPLFGPYGDVPPDRVWFFWPRCLKQGIQFDLPLS